LAHSFGAAGFLVLNKYSKAMLESKNKQTFLKWPQMEYKSCHDCPTYQKSVFCRSAGELFFSRNLIYFEEGDILFNEGQLSRGVFCIRDGSFLIKKKNKDGERIVITQTVPGELIGATSILISDENKYSTTAEAATAGSACFIPSNEFEKILRANSNISMNLMQLIIQKLNKLDN
jgi:hypothetical protein